VSIVRRSQGWQAEGIRATLSLDTVRLWSRGLAEPGRWTPTPSKPFKSGGDGSSPPSPPGRWTLRRGWARVAPVRPHQRRLVTQTRTRPSKGSPSPGRGPSRPLRALPHVRQPTASPLRARRPSGRLTPFGRLARGGLSSRRSSPASSPTHGTSHFEHAAPRQRLGDLPDARRVFRRLRAARPGPSHQRTRDSTTGVGCASRTTPPSSRTPASSGVDGERRERPRRAPVR
jgi:hypothetical protein